MGFEFSKNQDMCYFILFRLEYIIGHEFLDLESHSFML